MATHSSVLAWRIPGTGEPGGLPSMELHRVGHDWSDLAAAEVTNWASLVAQLVQNPTANAGDARDVDSIIGSGRSPGVGNGNPLQYSCLENPMDRGSSWYTVCGIAKSWTQLSDWAPGIYVCHAKINIQKWVEFHYTNNKTSEKNSCVRGFPVGTVVKNLPDSAGEARNEGLIPGSGRSPGVGNGNPLQYSFLEKSIDRGSWWAIVHGVAKSLNNE